MGTQRPRPTARARQTDAGIARGPGLAVAGVTAAIVFVIGLELFPVKSKQPPVLPPPPPPIAQTPPPPPPPSADAAVSALPGGDAGLGAVKPLDAAAAIAEKADNAEKSEPKDEAGESAKSDKSAEDGEAKPIDKQRQADKDLAREAWRRNRPDVSVSGNKTAILVPIKGSIKGADFKIIDKKRKVIVTLPKAVSMVTLRVYNLKHPSFKKVWIDQDEANAQPADGTKLRFILSQTFDPQVEITDDFVRVSIRRPESGDSGAESSEKKPEKRERSERSERREKSVERSERAEPAEEAPAPAPAPEKSGD